MNSFPRWLQIIAYALALFFGVAGLWVVAFSGRELFLSERAAAWPGTVGSIVKDDCESTNVPINNEGGPTTDVRRLEYTYSVNSHSYTGHRWKFGIPVATNGCHAEFSKGQQVNVFYDLDDPSNSVLLPTDRGALYFGFLVGVLFIGVSLYSYRQIRRQMMAHQS